MTWKQKTGIVIAAVVLLWLFIPTTDIVSPDWNVQFTDTEGKPLPGVSVTVFSQQYAVETSDVEDTKVTGTDGRAHFDVRKLRATGPQRFVGVIRNLNQGVHASFGVHTHLYGDKAGYGYPTKLELFGRNERESMANGSEHQTSNVVLMKCAPGYGGMGAIFRTIFQSLYFRSNPDGDQLVER